MNDYQRPANPLSSLYSTEFDALQLKIASPEKIQEWSWGEVTKPETINYRTQRSEKNGLFDEKIFGPEKDYECYCGKYKGIRYKGIVCEKCGVEITRSIVRRERMGHIELASPVSHVWFLRSVPSRMALILGLKSSDLEKVVYFAGYIVTNVNEEERAKVLKELEDEFKQKLSTLDDEDKKDKLRALYQETKDEIQSIKKGAVIDDSDFNRFVLKYGGMFDAEVGAEAIYNIFRRLNLEKLAEKLQGDYDKTRSVAKRTKIRKRLKVIRGMSSAGIRPEWMFLTRIPVLPPALRPMVALEGGRHATSDVNDLYRRVINRNNRLKKLIAINAPHVILRNEKRILQEAVDALVDNSIRRGGAYATGTSQRRPLKSLSDNLKGKQGLFRQNLLGKRVDYSARSVIVIGPTLELDECGVPKHMALELFRPFVVSKLIETELAYNIRGANKLIDEGIPEVWAILEEVIEGKYVLLNRAPTLHRLGIQAFRPVLVEGKAIQVHPLVCSAFNADFDGDQMAVHVPLSEEAQKEAASFMAADKNILRPGSGEVITNPAQDIILGCFWMTKIVDGKEGEGMTFASPNYAITSFDYGAVDFRARIKILPTESEKYAQFNGELFETSVGRLLFNSVLPSDFPYVNEEITKKKMHAVIQELMEHYGIDRVAPILDRIKSFGFKYATHAGITWGLDDISVPEEKSEILANAQSKVDEINEHYNNGLLSERERFQKVTQIWSEAKDLVEKALFETLDPNGSVYDMMISGARGSLKQLTQMAGMKGLVVNTRGEAIEFPVTTGSFEGHTPTEYFITTHGSRKGLTDTALNTATAGYLTRKLFDVAQDVVITEEDCGSKEFITVQEENLGGLVIPLSRSIEGRYIATDVKDPKTGDTLFKKGTYLSPEDARAIEDAGIESVDIYSPLTCTCSLGLSKMCYGKDLSTNEPVDLGEAVGTIAAQAIGEPGTQLTMRTFHSGGTASVGGDIVSGLPRIIEIFERRTPKNPAVISKTGGTVSEIEENGVEKIIRVLPDVEDKKKVKGKKESLEYRVRQYRTPLIAVGDRVEKGQFLTDGSADLQELLKYAGKRPTQEYIIREILKVYELQGASISRKHLEVIVAQMFSRMKVTKAGDTNLAPGQIIDQQLLDEENELAKAEGGQKAETETVILGISEVALSRKSFLSAASFQNTTRVLIDASLSGSVDDLKGLKENVIVGRLIPAGTGYKGSKKYDIIKELQDERDARTVSLDDEE